MMLIKNKNYLFALSLSACVLATAACTDDLTVPVRNACVLDEDCLSNHCLDDGMCMLISNKGDACNGETIVCDYMYDCVDGVCKDAPFDPNRCGSDDQCPEDQICFQNTCSKIEYVDVGEPCETHRRTKVCMGDLLCHNGKCMTKTDAENDIVCRIDADCARKPDTVCLRNHKCGKEANTGEFCNEDDVICPERDACIYNQCMTILEENEPCGFDENQICSPEKNLQCYENVCLRTAYDLSKGESCNNYNLFCRTPLTCDDGTCKKLNYENAPCNDAEYESCAEGFACVKSICIPVGSACASSKDCKEKDSFCCLSESCGAPNKCIPYDEQTTHDEMCKFETKPGIFEAQIQCRWQPPKDQVPGSNKVEMPPLVGHFGNKAGLETVVAFYSYSPTAIRFMHPETCETLETISVGLQGRWNNYPAAIDLDGDGLMEFITATSGGKTIVYKWDEKEQKHTELWSAGNARYAIMTYDINGDGKPEIISGTTVIAADGTVLFNGTGGSQSHTPAIGIFDNDPQGIASMVYNNKLYKWQNDTNTWKELATFAAGGHTAYADFGTPGKTPEEFDFTKLDGKPEIAISGGSKLRLYALTPKADSSGTYDTQLLMDVRGFSTGGPVTIGDFDSDGLPEIGVASSGLFGVYDPRCTQYEEGKCADKHVLWERWSQDASSGQTGSSLFDFDGDGQAEAVYADECFTRVYDGKTGSILFSAKRSSGTSIEGPVIADIDNDGSAEILMGSDSPESCATDTNSTDPLHEGIRCIDNEDCPTSKNCNKALGLCTCETDNDCNTQYAPGKTTYLQQYACVPPIHPQVGFMTNPKNSTSRTMVKQRGTRPDGWTSSNYKVCRATRVTNDIGISDLMIFKDRLDRWVSSRNLWNQHAYNIINVEDNGQVPSVSTWMKNWLAKNTGLTIEGTSAPRPLYNNYRLNKQGSFGAGTAPDITGRFIPDAVCGTNAEGKHVISGKLCNRGTKPVSSKLPASFFYYDETKPDNRGQKLCTSYTSEKIDIGECGIVGCEVTSEELQKLAGHDIIMVSNLDEKGFASTVECNTDNNTDKIHIDSCATTPIIY